MNEDLKNILERTTTLYFKYGIKSVTMDDVARELGISKKTLYQHVKDKGDLVEKVVDIDLAMMTEQFTRIFNSKKNAIEQVLDVNKLINTEIKEVNHSVEFDLRKYYPKVFAKVKKARRQFSLEMNADNIREGIKQGLYRSDIDPDIIAKLYYLKLEALIDTDLFTIEEFTSRAVFHQDFLYHIRGIASEKGLKILEEKLKEIKQKNNE